MSSLIERLKKSNTIENADVLKNSKFFIDSYNTTEIPILDIAMSAKLDGGYSHGSTLIGGDSATFKTMFMIQLAKAHLNNFEDKDCVFVFYDIEHATHQGIFENAGLDTSKIFHKPFTTIEQLTTDMVRMLDDLTEDDNICIGIDSLGAAKSQKSVDSALSGDEKRDMTAQQAMGNFWGNVNPRINTLKIPMFAIAQVYADIMNPYGPKIFRGGSSMYYYPNSRWLITKRKETDSKKEKVGSTFTVNIEKSRRVIEGSKFPVTVTFEDGIDKYSGIFDLGLDLGFISRPTTQTASLDFIQPEPITGRRKLIETPENMQKLIDNPDFKSAVHKKFSLGILDRSDSEEDDNETLPEEQEATKTSKAKSKKSS